jgi:hypothetical protein
MNLSDYDYRELSCCIGHVALIRPERHGEAAKPASDHTTLMIHPD